MIEYVCYCLFSYLVLSRCLLPCDTLCMQLCFSITLLDCSLHTRKIVHVFFCESMICVDVFPNFLGTVGRSAKNAGKILVSVRVKNNSAIFYTFLVICCFDSPIRYQNTTDSMVYHGFLAIFLCCNIQNHYQVILLDQWPRSLKG